MVKYKLQYFKKGELKETGWLDNVEDVKNYNHIASLQFIEKLEWNDPKYLKFMKEFGKVIEFG